MIQLWKHTQQRQRKKFGRSSERERAVGESKMQKWVAGLLGFKQMEFMEGMLCVGREREREKRKNNQKRTADRQAGRQAGRQAVAGLKE